MTDIGGVLAMILTVFFAIVVIAILAPVLGQLGGGLYEAGFVFLAFLVVIAGVLGYSRR